MVLHLHKAYISSAHLVASGCHIGQHRCRVSIYGVALLVDKTVFVNRERKGTCTIQINQLHVNNQTLSQLCV